MAAGNELQKIHKTLERIADGIDRLVAIQLITHHNVIRRKPPDVEDRVELLAVTRNTVDDLLEQIRVVRDPF